ncbi:MAG: nucleotidyltransferase domain-containing protein [Candidatus Hadarchaeum sp.]
MAAVPNQEKEQAQEALRVVVEALQQGLGDNLVAVVLFGSRARGEATAGSDWDLFVLARDLPPGPLQRHIQLITLLPVQWRGQAAILARTLTEFESHLSSLMLDIALDGIILYDPEGYAAHRLAVLKRLITNRGLHRERIGHDFVWKWDQFPGSNWSLEWKEVL